jgi:hypothetical protein
LADTATLTIGIRGVEFKTEVFEPSAEDGPDLSVGLGGVARGEFDMAPDLGGLVELAADGDSDDATEGQVSVVPKPPDGAADDDCELVRSPLDALVTERQRCVIDTDRGDLVDIEHRTAATAAGSASQKLASLSYMRRSCVLVDERDGAVSRGLNPLRRLPRSYVTTGATVAAEDNPGQRVGSGEVGAGDGEATGRSAVHPPAPTGPRPTAPSADVTLTIAPGAMALGR